MCDLIVCIPFETIPNAKCYLIIIFSVKTQTRKQCSIHLADSLIFHKWKERIQPGNGSLNEPNISTISERNVDGKQITLIQIHISLILSSSILHQSNAEVLDWAVYSVSDVKLYEYLLYIDIFIQLIIKIFFIDLTNGTLLRSMNRQFLRLKKMNGFRGNFFRHSYSKIPLVFFVFSSSSNEF